MHRIVLFGIFLLIFLLVLVLYIRKRVHRKLYQPVRKHSFGISDSVCKDLYLYPGGKQWTLGNPKSGYNQINVWYLYKYPGAKIVLYFHGNKYNISFRNYMIQICERMHTNILLVDYRGYGRSDGKPGPIEVLEDAETAYNFLRCYHKAKEIVVWGESLGGTPALWVAAYKQISGLLLLSTFTSLHSVISGNHPLYAIIRAITHDIDSHTNNLALIKKVTAPVLIYHSREDNLINYNDAKKLLNTVPHNKKALITINGPHDAPKFTEDQFRYTAKFLNCEGNIRYDEIVNIIDNIGFMPM